MYLRDFTGGATRIIADNAGDPFFSPDGQWLGFFADGSLKKVPVDSGPVVTLSPAPTPRGGTWGDDGHIVFAPLSRSGLSIISADGGAPRPLTTLDLTRGETSHRSPEVLPGSQAVVFTAEGTDRRSSVMVVTPGGGAARSLVPGGVDPAYASTGHLLYRLNGRLMAARLDEKSLVLTGNPVQMIERAGAFGISRTGMLVYRDSADEAGQLVWVDRAGNPQPLPITQTGLEHPRISPDGSRIVMQAGTPDENIWVYDLGRDRLSRLTFEGRNLWPLWMTTGARIAYGSNRVSTSWDVVSRPADGSGSEEPILIKPQPQVPRAASPDGRLLAVTHTTDTSNFIDLLTLDTKAPPRRFPNRPAEQPAFSPDSRFLAYVQLESPTREVYVEPVHETEGRWQVSTGGGTEPVWAKNGRELFYRNGDQLFVVDVTLRPTFSAGKPRLLFRGRFRLGGTGSANYDVTADGQKFLMLQLPLPDARLNVVMNWFTDLKARAR
jgi:serine/threonine-protein kinase